VPVPDDERLRRRGQAVLEGVQPFGDVVEDVACHQRAHEVAGKHRTSGQDLRGQQRHPNSELSFGSSASQLGGGDLDEVRCVVDVAGREGMPYGCLDVAGRLVPLAGAAVQHADVAGAFGQQSCVEDVGEEAVVAVPAAVVVQRDQQQVAPLQRLQHRSARPAVGRAGDRVAQRAAQPLEHGGV
jgi:hypothetical protein